jgi:hypothetical protein
MPTRFAFAPSARVVTGQTAFPYMTQAFIAPSREAMSMSSEPIRFDPGMFLSLLARMGIAEQHAPMFHFRLEMAA